MGTLSIDFMQIDVLMGVPPSVLTLQTEVRLST